MQIKPDGTMLHLRLHLFLVIAALLTATSVCHAWLGKVVYVADGDTFDVERDGKKIRVRLYGVDTPESTQAFGQNAMAFTSSQIMGKTVDVQKIDVDRNGRIVGIVSVGNCYVPESLIPPVSEYANPLTR